ARHEIGDAVAERQQLALLAGMEQTRRESGAMQHRPETISRAAEVLLHRRGVQAGIDAAEEDAQVWRDDVGKGLAGRGEDFFLRGLHGRRRSRRRRWRGAAGRAGAGGGVAAFRSAFAFARVRSSALRARMAAMRSWIGTSSFSAGLCALSTSAAPPP